jgi:hypothetical protein
VVSINDGIKSASFFNKIFRKPTNDKISKREIIIILLYYQYEGISDKYYLYSVSYKEYIAKSGMSAHEANSLKINGCLCLCLGVWCMICAKDNRQMPGALSRASRKHKHFTQLSLYFPTLTDSTEQLSWPSSKNCGSTRSWPSHREQTFASLWRI